MTKKIIIYCLFCLTAYLAFYSLTAYSSSSETKANFESPYNSVRTHLVFLQNDNYKPNLAAKSLNTSQISRSDAEDLAIKLKRIFDGRGLFVIMDEMPKDANYLDTLSQEHKFVVFPEIPSIYLQKYGKKWLYSLETVSLINDLYKSTYPIDTFSFVEELPEFWKYSIFSVYVWQITGFILAAIFSYFIYVLLYWILGYFIVKSVSKFIKPNLYIKYIKPVSKPLSIFLVFWIFDQLVFLLSMPIKVSSILDLIIRAIQPILITLIAFRLSDFLVDFIGSLAAKTKSNNYDQLVPFVSKGLRVVVVIFGILYFFSNVGIDVTPLIAGVSIGGLAFALAAQDTVKNLFGSVTIFTDQPFQVGDWIVVDGAEGTVEEVGIRSTRIRTFYNSLISVPNGKLSDAKIDNMGRRDFRRYVTSLSVTYDTPPELIDAFVVGLKKIVQAHPKTHKTMYQIHLNDFADSSIQVLFYIFFSVPDWTQELEARHEVISEIIKLAKHLGVRFAFPTQTLHVEDFSEKTSLTPKHINVQESSMKLIENYEPFKK